MLGNTLDSVQQAAIRVAARSFHVQLLRRASAPLPFSCCFGLDSETVWECFRSLVQRDILSDILIPHVCHCAQHIPLPTFAVYDFDVAPGDGTGGLWRTAVVHVLDGQLVSRDT